jgi:Ca2+-binding RTX toxin-like protein
MRLAVALAALALGLVSAAPAHATLLVRSDSTGLLVQDKNDLGDRVVISATVSSGGSPRYLVTNNNAFDIFKFDRQAGCSAGDSDNQVVCSRASGKLNLAMAGGDDEVRVGSSGASSTSVNLGTGSDDYYGIGGPDNVFAASGNDFVFTEFGDDVISIGTGNDFVRAGPGNNRIDIGAGDDTGPDDLKGEAGNDTIALAESRANQRIVDSANQDSITTGSGNDRILAGAGTLLSFNDSTESIGVFGSDNISTNAGDDKIVSKESGFASADTVKCGFGFDQVEADLKDSVDKGTCEERDVSPVGETPHVRLARGSLRVASNGRVRVRLRCPLGVGSLGCKGRLSLRLDRREARSARKRYAIRAGRGRTVSLRLPRGSVQALRRRQTRGVLTSIEKGRKGRKTTVRNPRLRLR